MGPVGPSLELTDIQGNILHGYRSAQAAYLFFSFAPDSGRAFLTYLVGIVRDAVRWGTAPPDTAVNVALTYAGLRALGVDSEVLDALPDAFRADMADRAAEMLDDCGPSAPDTWDDPLGKGIAHLLVTVNRTGPDPAIFDSQVNEVKAAAKTAGAILVHDQPAESLDQRREHFGWADGFGQPAIAGVTDDPIGGSPQADGSWTFVEAGEFVHGYPNEDGLVTSGPTAPLLQNGTFMVYRKLQQDVVTFRARLWADALRLGETLTDNPLTGDQLYELAAAKVVGRWRDGMPIEDAESRPPGNDVKLGDVALTKPNNDFRFGRQPVEQADPKTAQTDDLDGRVCPLGAHIRRTNPRDALGWAGGSQMTSTHRIIRRGMPYGTFKPFVEDEEDDGVDRGLIFICFNASIERQFEVVQRQWCNDGNAFGLGNEKDYLLGDHLLDPVTGNPTGRTEPDGRLGCPDFSVQGDGAPFRMTQGAPVVRTCGSEYLLMPGIEVLRQLASGYLDASPSPPGESKVIDEVVGLATEELAKKFLDGSPQVTRDQHAKAHGCVQATFEVLDGLPDDLRVGLFAEAGSYDALIRFSSRASERKTASDAKRDAHGMAIKVLGVNGPKFLPGERDATTQDFVLANSDTFFCRDANEYLELTIARTKGFLGYLSFALPSIDPRSWRLKTLLGALRATGQKVSNPLQIRYWSQTPSALGPQVVKYSAKPHLDGPPPRQTGVNTKDGLEVAMATQLDSSDATFAFMVQLQLDPAAMPIEDPTVRWDENVSPFVTVAMLHIPSQNFRTDSRKELGENLSFTPWHTLPAHQPLGGINRVRRAVYESISDARHNRNGIQAVEPMSAGPASSRANP